MTKKLPPLERAPPIRNWGHGLAEARLSSAFAIIVFVGFGIASAVLLGMIYGEPWLTVLVITGAAALAV